MSDLKCCASVDGICQNVYGYGTRCNGYSQECKLRPGYLTLQKAAESARNTIKRAYGIKGDLE